jgi:hypothetical protein
MKIEDLPATLCGPANRRLVEAWLRWRGDRLLPSRADVELRDISGGLAHIGIAEVLPDNVLLRIAGTALNRIYGADLTGRTVRDFTAPADWPLRFWRLKWTVMQPCASIYARRDVLEDGRVVVYEAAAMPLDPSEGSPNRQIIWSTVPLDESFTLASPAARRVIPVALEYRHVDIGAGLPDLASAPS